MTVLITFIQKAIGQAVGMLFGATGEIITEKVRKPESWNSGYDVYGRNCRSDGSLLL